MPDPKIAQRLRGLVLSAKELVQLNPDWKPAMVEDYLTLFENFITLADYLDSSYLPDLVFGDDYIEVIDNGDGSINLNNEGMEAFSFFMSSLGV